MVGIIPTIGFVAKEGALTAFLARGRRRVGVGHRRPRRGRARVGAHRGVRHPLLLGCVLDEEGCRGRAAAAHRVARPADRLPRRPGRARRAHRRRRLRGAASRHRARPVRRHRTGLDVPACPRRSIRTISRCGTGSSPRCGSRSRRSCVGVGVFCADRAIGRSARILPVHGGRRLQRERCAASPACRCVTTSFTQRGSLPVYVGTIFVVFVAAEGTALLAGRGVADAARSRSTPRCSSSSRRS